MGHYSNPPEADDFGRIIIIRVAMAGEMKYLALWQMG